MTTSTEEVRSQKNQIFKKSEYYLYNLSNFRQEKTRLEREKEEFYEVLGYAINPHKVEKEPKKRTPHDPVFDKYVEIEKINKKIEKIDKITNAVAEVLKNLSGKQACVVYHKYFTNEYMTKSHICKKMGITPEEYEKIKKNVLYAVHFKTEIE